MSQPLASSIQQTVEANSTLRVGIVQSIDSDSTITVNVAGGIINSFPYLNSYSPAVGDNVNLELMNATWVCIGKVGGGVHDVIAGVHCTTATTAVTSGGTELDLPFLTMLDVPLRNGHMYEMACRLICKLSVGTDIFAIRFRQDAATPNGTIFMEHRWVPGSTVAALAINVAAMLEVTSAQATTDLFVSVVQVTGTGTLTATSRSGSGLSSHVKVTDNGFLPATSGSSWRAS